MLPLHFPPILCTLWNCRSSIMSISDFIKIVKNFLWVFSLCFADSFLSCLSENAFEDLGGVRLDSRTLISQGSLRDKTHVLKVIFVYIRYSTDNFLNNQTYFAWSLYSLVINSTLTWTPLTLAFISFSSVFTYPTFFSSLCAIRPSLFISNCYFQILWSYIYEYVTSFKLINKIQRYLLINIDQQWYTYYLINSMYMYALNKDNNNY